ncbi:porin [Cupriavidus sp. 2TAF22]|uniref:porin n=1 Tax=unclassified Cupriavidus TaxID=2640874 RepID=UPI003F9119E0
MKLNYVAMTALMSFPLISAAQSVTLYGVVDTGIEYVNNIGAKKDSVVRIPGTTGSVPSRWGIRGTEDLGGGVNAVFVLESGFSPDSGVSNQAGRLFGRQAYVGLNGLWGQVAFGRQYTMLFWSTLDADLLGPNAFGSASLDPGIANARSDNTISYKGKFGGMTAGATYSFGRDVANASSPAGTNCAGENPADKRACTEWSVLLQYETRNWGVSTAYDSMRGGPGAFGGLTRSSLTDDRFTINGYALVGNAKLGAGVIRRDNKGSTTPRSNLWFVGGSLAITPAWNIDTEAHYLKFSNSPNKAWLFVARTTYDFSKRTRVYGSVGYIDNRGDLAISVSSAAAGSNPASGGNQLGLMVGIKHIF